MTTYRDLAFVDLYGNELDIELGSADRSQLFTTLRRQNAINDAMHNFERTTRSTLVQGQIPVTATLSTRIKGVTLVVTITSGGSGYSVNDVLTFTGGTFTTASQLTVTAVSSGVITAVNITTNGLYTVVPVAPIAVTGGTGTGATFTVTWDGTAEYDLFANFANFISLEERRYPSIKRVTSTGVVSWVDGDENFQFHAPTSNDALFGGWRADPAGVPGNFYFRDDSGTTYLGLDPPPDQNNQTETWTLYVPYLAASADMVADGDLPFTVNGKALLRLRPYRRALVHFAAALLEPLRKNYTAAQVQMGKYAQYIADYEKKWMRDGTDQVVFARNYFADSSRPTRPVDPHRFP